MKTFVIPYNFFKYNSVVLICVITIACGQTEQAEPAKPQNQPTLFEAYSLYREDFKNENYTDALKYLKIVLDLNPCFRKTPFKDGAFVYKYFIENTTNPIDQKKYIDALSELYKLRINCFGE